MTKAATPPDTNIGVPMPTVAIPDAYHLIAYYGPTPLVPSLTQQARIDLGLATGVPTQMVKGNAYYVCTMAQYLPANLPAGSYDFAFTFMDANNNESGFSALTTLVLAGTAPLPPGAPVPL